MDDHNEFRINIRQKSIVTEQLTKYKSLLMKLLDGQSQLNEDDKIKLLQEPLTNFEIAVQLNILVNGLSWNDAPEENSEDSECNTLDDLLDAKIVQTTWKRSAYPKKILPYVVRSLKVERNLMNMYEKSITPQEVKRDPKQDAIMINVTAAAPTMFKQASTVIESLKALRQMTEGLHQVLNMQPSAKTLETYKDVFGGSNGKRQPVSKSTIPRVLAETEYSMDYVPVIKHPHASTLED